MQPGRSPSIHFPTFSPGLVGSRIGGVSKRLLLLPLLALALAACGSSSDSSSSSSGSSSSKPAANACTKDKLDLKNSGTLTVGTDKPAYPPYFADNDPTNGKGFESAVAYAVAKQLGFSSSEVQWKTVPFNSSYAPGSKDFDFDINEISITPKRAKRVDFSSSYYTAPQAVVALKSSKAASATSFADLKDAKLGVQLGTTSLDAVTEKIQPSSQPQVFNDSNDTVRALKIGRVETIVVDLPTAFYITAAQVPSAKIVGKFDAPGGDSWGLLAEKGSSLTGCLTQAVDKLKSDGTLNRLTERWMGGKAGAPTLG
jgi:polar amino acid transport system substrate-binding protein